MHRHTIFINKRIINIYQVYSALRVDERRARLAKVSHNDIFIPSTTASYYKPQVVITEPCCIVCTEIYD